MKLATLKVYEFLYNSMIEESAYTTMSIHITREGAEKSMKAHQKKEKEDWISFYSEMKEKPPCKFNKFKDWRIQRRHVLE